MQKTLERQEEFLRSVFLPGQSSVGPMVKLGFVKLVDATDHLHAIPMDVCDSFEVSLPINYVFEKRTHPIVSSDSMSSSSFYSNATQTRLEFRDSIWRKDVSICVLTTTSK
jgi:hypothetical protein